MNPGIKFNVLAALILVLTVISCSKTDTTPQPDNDTYFPKVKTIIANNCLSCHSSTGEWSGRPVKLDTDSDISALYMAIKKAVADPITITNKRMPQGGSLSESDIDIILKWYNKGGQVTD